jgi:hypothetical protein
MELLAGQRAGVESAESDGDLAGSVTVTAVSPLVETTQSKIDGKHRSEADAGASGQRAQLPGFDAGCA